MMKKKESFTNTTPLPSFIPRQLVLDLLHSHGEIITLNPLVLSHTAIQAPREAPAEEYYSTWYEIVERVQMVPGMGKLGSGKISFRACFHDVPWGVQTHVYAPMGIDLRHNYRVGGNQPGEPPEHRELGSGAPPQGLYLKEEIEIRCNFAMTSFVRSQLKAATKVLVDRLIKKAELLDAGVLKAMMDDGGKLKTVNPADRSLLSPSSPATSNNDNKEEHAIVPMYLPPQYQSLHSQSQAYPSEKTPSPFSPASYSPAVQSPTATAPTAFAAPAAAASPGNSFANELPGDTSFYYPPVSPSQQQLAPPGGQNYRDSYQSTVSSNASAGGWYSPSDIKPGTYTAELPTTQEEGAGHGNKANPPQGFHFTVPDSHRN